MGVIIGKIEWIYVQSEVCVCVISGFASLTWPRLFIRFGYLFIYLGSKYKILWDNGIIDKI